MWFLAPARADHLRGGLGRVTPEPADVLACGKTLMRHFLPERLAVPSLARGVSMGACGGLLVSTTGQAQRLSPLRPSTGWPTVQVAPIAPPAQHDEPSAPPTQKGSESPFVLVDGVSTPPPTSACLPEIAAVPSPRRSSSGLWAIFDTERCGLPHTAALTLFWTAAPLYPQRRSRPRIQPKDQLVWFTLGPLG
jgi:hypothetical protein